MYAPNNRASLTVWLQSPFTNKIGTVITLIRKLRLRQVDELAQGHKAIQCGAGCTGSQRQMPF